MSASRPTASRSHRGRSFSTYGEPGETMPTVDERWRDLRLVLEHRAPAVLESMLVLGEAYLFYASGSDENENGGES